ncbi:hypothetical protein BD560DRAFT_408047 [Blakeslea trispora]|nr:hypothetical protein BD560DRAFT_408047 [Blakeslea trispora]
MTNIKSNDNLNSNKHSKVENETDMFEELDDEMLAMLVEDLVWPETPAQDDKEKRSSTLPDESEQSRGHELVNAPEPIIHIENMGHQHSDAIQPTLSQRSPVLIETHSKQQPIHLIEQQEEVVDSVPDVQLQENTPKPTLRVSLRQRNAIQLHPFTLEYAQYRKMMSHSATRRRAPFSISNADSPLESLLVVTQEEDSDQPLGSQYIPDHSATQSDELPTSIEKDEFASSQDEEVDFDSEHFDKYHLEKLILPKAAAAIPSQLSKTLKTPSSQKKVITFDKRKKNNKSLSTARSSSGRDIFSFQPQPQATFEIATLNKHKQYPDGQEKDIFAFPDDDDSYLYEEDEEEELQLKRTLRTKRRRIIPEDSEEEEEANEQPNSSHDIFKMPKRIKPNPKGLERSITDDDDVIPIVQDEYEFKQSRRRRMDIHDVLKKKNALNGLLPASFVKTFEKDIREEGKRHTAPRPPSKSTASKTSKAKFNTSTKSKSTEDIFASFLDSQSESEGTDVEDNNASSYLDCMEPDIFSDHEYDEVSFDRAPIPHRQIPSTISMPKDSPQQLSRSKASADHKQILPKQKRVSKNNSLDESIEDNRIRNYDRPAQSKNSTSQRKKKRTPKMSSIAIKKPPHLMNHPMRAMHVQNNPAPHRRRKRPKRSKDDIYVHAPLFSRLWFDKSGQAPDINSSVFFRKPELKKRRAFDDIYVGTTFSARYACEPLDLWSTRSGTFESTNHPFDAGLHVIHSLESIAKRIRHLYDHDLRRIRGLTHTVYLHHQLLKPLLSATPDLKSAYLHLQQAFSRPFLFKKNIVWSTINFSNKGLIDFLFFKASSDLSEAFSQNKYAHLDTHDSFYVFVSLCLTQWIPKFAYTERLRMTEVFLNHIRSLTWLSAHLLTVHPKPLLPFRMIIKLQLFCLDWTCRLHHLGVRPSDWSVVDCTQTLMDTLIYAGYEDINASPVQKHYLVEAWVCLIQIMSVSSQGAGYCFYEKVFLDQLKSSIKRKAKDSVPNEFEKRKTTRMWAETLNYILDKYMMLSSSERDVIA